MKRTTHIASFTGKERDEETGYGYFGARYMDHELTAMWLSVDPMADKYPGLSPYAYCTWNPVKLKDPNGMETIGNDDGWKIDRYKKTITRVSTEGGSACQYINDNGSSRILLGSQSDVLNQFEGFTLIDNVQNGTQISQTEDKDNSSSDILNACVGSAVGGVGNGCHNMSKVYFDKDKGTYMGKDGSQKLIQRGKNGGLGGRYTSQRNISANYAKAAGVLKGVGHIMTLYSIYSTEQQFDNGEISSQERWTNHAVTVVSHLPYCWHAPFFYELGKNYGPSTW